MSQNKKRFFVEAVDLAAKEQGIETHWMSDNWICELKKGSQRAYIYGSRFSLNPATSQELAQDKSATSILLEKNSIPCVVHKVFIRPGLENFELHDTNSKLMFEYADKIGYPLVCKDNYGTGGNNVFKIHNKEELERVSSLIWKTSRGVALCPFFDVECEYRFFVLDGEIQFIFKKIIKENSDGWKFNLSQDGVVEYGEFDEVKGRMSDMAIQAAQTLDLQVCSIDIIKLKGSDTHLVLEINTSISTEKFSESSDTAREASLKFYSNILKKIFS